MHALISTAQSKHGIRQDDYHRYRKYCTRRLGRVRSSLSPKEPGRRKTFVRELPKDTPITYLLRAERAIAYALALRRESVTEPRKVYHERKLWRKALKTTLVLYELVQNDTNSADLNVQWCCSTNLLQAYRTWIEAQVHFSYQRWDECARCFTQCRRYLEQLNKDSDESRAFIDTRLHETASLVEYCKHMGATNEDLEESDAMICDQMPSDLANVTINSIQWKVEQDCVPLIMEISLMVGQKNQRIKRLLDRVPTKTYSKVMKKYLQLWHICLEVSAAWGEVVQMRGEDINKIFLQQSGIHSLQTLAKKGAIVGKMMDRFITLSIPVDVATECRKLRPILANISRNFQHVVDMIRGRTNQSVSFHLVENFEGKSFAKVKIFGFHSIRDIFQEQLEKISKANAVIKARNMEMTPAGPAQVSQYVKIHIPL